MMRGPIWGTKVCPRCGEVVFDDMSVCYGCLYDFSKDTKKDEDVVVARRELCSALPADGLPGPDAGEPGPDAGKPGADDALDLTAPLEVVAGGVPAVLVRTGSVDFLMDVPPDGLVVGRDPSCDLVLHSPAVSARHVRLLPTQGGISVVDLGATNPAVLSGRPVRGVELARAGETLDVCGALVTVVGCEAAYAPGSQVRVT